MAKTVTQLAWRLMNMTRLEAEAQKLRDGMGTNSISAQTVLGDDDDLREWIERVRIVRTEERRLLVRIEREAHRRRLRLEKELTRFEAELR